MKDEIKEILYVLKHIVIGRASRLTPREADKLLDYITNLQQELERYKNIIDELEKDLNILIEDNGISPNSKEDFKYILNKLKELKGE